ncbi:hypothetical protein COV49_03800 [Candidatus Falkowbacteria bacterium CG11_big_fil_rev_8_21_14_0_20_39_10]|uniref:Uncharacterized protein n=1 Tax=Candidatus Falkowbacteria bacterium CG11_big_fil_rev_8_21_14_0_20_39_10 TaxID=1974570 RepID=A0A2M6K8A3_9BACT|nr:MAG: hypothetical protein COV49_03800 [Candidatus Falkowbacteria bacterium CG11_big_fil_rev_8_21_14_0_20_39_10]
MNLSAKVAYNTIIQMVSKIISTVFGLIAVAIMTRYLGQAGFGQYTTIVTFLSFFGIIADLGLTLVTVQMISQPSINQEKVLGNLFGLRLASAVIFLGLAPLTIVFFPYEPIIKLGVAITALSFFFIALNQILVGLFQKELRMDKVSIAEVVSRIILVIGVFLAVKLNYGLKGILWATVVSSAINFFLHFIFAKKFVFLRPRFDLPAWKEIMKKSWPLAVTIIFNLVYLKSDTLFLSIVKTQSEVGIYGAAYKVIDVLVTLPFMFAGVILPVLSASWAKKNIAYFKESLQRSFDFMVILALPMVVGTQFVANRVMAAVAGEEFAVSGSVLKILILAAGFIYLGGMFSHAIIALDKQKKIIGAYVFTSLTALIGYFIFIPRYSYFGAAWVTIYSELVIFLAAGYYVWKYSGFLPKMEVVFKSTLACLIMALGLNNLPAKFYQANGGLFIILAAAALVYFVALYLFKGVRKKDLLALIDKS